MSRECVCGHGSMISIVELLQRLKPEMTIQQVTRNAKCEFYGRKDAAHFMLHCVCKSRGGSV